MSAPRRIIAHVQSCTFITGEPHEAGNPDYGTHAYVLADRADNLDAANAELVSSLKEAIGMVAGVRGDVIATEAIHAWERTIAKAEGETCQLSPAATCTRKRW